MHAALSLLAALDTDFKVEDIYVPAGAAAGILAIIGLALVFPLFRNHRQEIKRLVAWQEREPERGDDGTEDFFPVSGPVTGEMTPAERVTADRPALQRITAEHAALESPSFFKRLIARGPTHPLLLSLVGVVAAVGIVFAINSAGQTDPEEDAPAKLDRSQVQLAILNGSSEKSLARKVASNLEQEGFPAPQIGSAAQRNKTIVFYAPKQKRAANVVARDLNADVEKLDPELRGEFVDRDADVVVVVGEDRV